MSKIKVVKPKKEKKAKRQRESKPKRRLLIAILPCLLVAVFCVAALAWAIPLIAKKPQANATAGYTGVLELWNVECFEGGSGSRSSWLTSKAAKFEQANKGLFVHVTNLTTEQMQAKLTAGDTFDIICFSRGAGNIVKDRLVTLDVDLGNVKENFRLSAEYDGKQISAPLYAGAYCLFARSAQLSESELLSSALSAKYTRKVGKNTFDLAPLICGFTSYNSPLSALAMSGGKGKAGLEQNVTQYQAYEQFVGNKTAITLLGTQRDIYRLSKKEADGKIDSLAFCTLSGYTDLVQYLGVSLDSGDKQTAAVEFVKYLLSKDVQASLVNLSLFSVLNDEFYTTARFADCEKGLGGAYVPNVFGDEQAIVRQREAAISTLAIS